MNRKASFTTAFAIAMIVNYSVAFTKTSAGCDALDDSVDDCPAPCKKIARFRYKHIALGDVGNALQNGNNGSFGKNARQIELMNGASTTSQGSAITSLTMSETTKEGAKDISCGYVCRKSVCMM